MPDPHFRTDLYQGAARDYDRYRPPYPQSLFDDLIQRTGLSGNGRVLDLACGTGQIAFALHGRFAEVWAVDQEPGMIEVVTEKAAAAGIGNIRALAVAAQDLPVDDGSFDLVAAGNAFHRLPRAAVAPLIGRWLRPGGYLALLWGGGMWGDAPWQQAMAAVRDRWTAEVGQRIPAEYDDDRKARPDSVILAEAGFEEVGRREFTVVKEWTAEDLIGYLFSTSVLSRAALGARVAEFEADLGRELLAVEPSGRTRQSISFACDLARRPE
jgi:SAM-dependent methyltransferase